MSDDKKIERLLDSFPKKRPPLPERYQSIYEAEYDINRGSVDAGPLYRILRYLESFSHLCINKVTKPGPVLELGAGNLNHIFYEPDTAPYDIVEPFKSSYEGSPFLRHVRNSYEDIAEIPEEAEKYGRIFSIGVLEHIEDLPKVVARSALLLREDGVFQAGLPSEGGFLWGLAWRCTTGLLFKLRTKLSYRTLMRHEHINEAPEMITLIRHFFENVRLVYYPIPLHHLSFYVYVEASNPRIEICNKYLGGLNS